MKRDIYKTLLKWKESSDRQPLILQGARQVGKTWILKAFGSQEFKNVCYLNFEETPRVKDFFNQDLNPKRILQDLAIHFEMKIGPETLLIFDEIQECPNALTSLKY